MPFISVVPAIRTPFGVDVFDYETRPTTSLAVGDLTLVPFRKRNLPALVIATSTSSEYAGRARTVLDNQLLHLGPASTELLAETAKRTFSSMPTVLAAWVRHVPQRAKPAQAGAFTSIIKPTAPSQQLRLYTAARISTVLEQARTAKGRVLILTPWQHRADMLAKALSASVLHADMADGAAWSSVASFAERTSSVLVATRIGSWLSCVADTVIVDEPENDETFVAAGDGDTEMTDFDDGEEA
jgi:hypothetical protein